MINKKYKKSAFTLVEMLIVIVIIGILASALIPRLGAVRGKARDAGRKAAVAQATTAMQIQGLDLGKYSLTPGSFDVISGTLKAGGMDIIPVDKNPGAAGSGCDINESAGVRGTGYGYIPVSKTTTGDNKAFVIFTCPESAGSANHIYCGTYPSPNSGSIATGTFISTITECTSITKSAVACENIPGACRYTSDDQLRYIFKYPSDN